MQHDYMTSNIRWHQTTTNKLDTKVQNRTSLLTIQFKGLTNDQSTVQIAREVNEALSTAGSETDGDSHR